MKRNSLTVLVGVLLIIIFVLLLFTFQVRQTEIALVTTFDRPTTPLTEPGFKWKWPVPVQRVYKFDKRVQSFDEDKIEQTLTADFFNIDIQVYIGWSVSRPELYFSSFKEGKIEAARPTIASQIRGAKLAVIGKHPFSHFVSTDTNELKFVQIEQEMLNQIKPALANYGIDVRFLGIKKLALPESVTQKVFDRMTEERKRQVAYLQSIGEAKAKEIRSNADRERDDILAQAMAKATVIRGQAEAAASRSYEVFDQNPDLALFLYKTRAIEEVGKQNTTYFLDTRTWPFDLLTTNYFLHPPTSNGLPSAIEGRNTISQKSP